MKKMDCTTVQFQSLQFLLQFLQDGSFKHNSFEYDFHVEESITTLLETHQFPTYSTSTNPFQFVTFHNGEIYTNCQV